MKEGQTQEPVGGMKPKPVKERDNLDLLELVCQTHSKAAMYWNNKEMHDAYVEARSELESRLTPPPSPLGKDVEALAKEYAKPVMVSDEFTYPQSALTKIKEEAFKAGYSASIPQSSTEEEKDDDEGWIYCPNCGRVKAEQ